MRLGLVRTIILAALAATFVALAAWKYVGGKPVAPKAPSPRELGASLLAQLGVDESKGAQHAAQPVFTDVASEMGLVFTHDNDAHGEYHLPEGIGPGAGFVDYDNDGDLDIILAGGGAITSSGTVQRCRLFRNDGATFADVTETALPIVNGQAFGVACADYDNDGWTDIYVTRLGPNVLLRNNGDGTFADVSNAAGVDDARFGASVTFLDFDRDGLLDLFVTNYVDWSASREKACYTPFGARDFCSPTVYEAPSTDALLRNRGDGTFEDVSERAGINASRGNGLGVVASDFDGDGWQDVYVANDQTPAAFWRNNADGTFTNIAMLNGTALDGRGVAIAGMGVACEDMNDDGRFDLFVTNIRDQTHLVLENEGKVFVDASARRGVGAWSVPMTAFGVAVFDQDNDGELDCFIANGAVNMSVESSKRPDPYAEMNQFMRLVNGRFVDASDLLNESEPHTSRAVVMGDYDNDGDIDLLVTNCGGPVQLLRNNARPDASWIGVDVRNDDGSIAIGAQVRVTVGDRTWAREVRPQQSYLASGDPRVHVGLGDASLVERIEITWPNGNTTEVTSVPAGQVVRVTPAGISP